MEKHSFSIVDPIQFNYHKNKNLLPWSINSDKGIREMHSLTEREVVNSSSCVDSLYRSLASCSLFAALCILCKLFIVCYMNVFLIIWLPGN